MLSDTHYRHQQAAWLRWQADFLEEEWLDPPGYRLRCFILDCMKDFHDGSLSPAEPDRIDLPPELPRLLILDESAATLVREQSFRSIDAYCGLQPRFDADRFRIWSSGDPQGDPGREEDHEQRLHTILQELRQYDPLQLPGARVQSFIRQRRQQFAATGPPANAISVPQDMQKLLPLDYDLATLLETQSLLQLTHLQELRVKWGKGSSFRLFSCKEPRDWLRSGFAETFEEAQQLARPLIA